MAGLDHGPNQGESAQELAGAGRRTRYGLALFFVYLVFYAGFVLLCAFFPQQMERTPVPGINLAILYGMALIVTALVLALLYGWLCREDAPGMRMGTGGEGESGGRRG